MKFLLDLLYPRCCPVCGRIVLPKGALICPSCIPKLSRLKGPLCRKCGKEVVSSTVEYCYDCTRYKRSFRRGMAVYNYNEAASRSMARIKYKNKREYLDFYGAVMSRCLGPSICRLAPQALVPVPVHPSRLRKRGFNQAEELARRLSASTGIPVLTDCLIRSRRTMPQKALGPAERLKNLQEAFSLAYIPSGLERVMLVDDIYTTGSTAEACTRILMAAGIKEVTSAVIFIGAGD